eukprot:TRINITY_DN19110_c0_g1_i1.p1 TRINITY_DN19110_c0_g1~~TRINITY_DN19110_c0_g1_i1.p1  ORF type:complete len:2817 (-),score=409.27 TRINITY_DN19110_c0_g1_i1:64-7707(-)
MAKAEAASVATALKSQTSQIRSRAAFVIDAFFTRGDARIKLSSSFEVWSKASQKTRQMQAAALALSRGCERATSAAVFAGWVDVSHAHRKQEADSMALKQAAARFRSSVACIHEKFDVARARYLMFLGFESWLRNRFECIIIELHEQMKINASSAADGLLAARRSVETKLARSIGAAGNLTVQGWSKAACSAVLTIWRKVCWQSQLTLSNASLQRANEQLGRYRMTTAEAALKRHDQVLTSKALLAWKQVCQLVRFQEHLGPALGRKRMQNSLQAFLMRLFSTWYQVCAIERFQNKHAFVTTCLSNKRLEQSLLVQALHLWSRAVLETRFTVKGELVSRMFKERLLRNGCVAVAALEASNATVMMGTLLGVWRGLAEDRTRAGMLNKRLKEKLSLCERTLIDGQAVKNITMIQLQRAFIDWARCSQSSRRARLASIALINGRGQALLAAVCFEWFRISRNQRHRMERNAACDDFQRKLHERGVRWTKWHCDREVEHVMVQRCMRAWILTIQRAHVVHRAVLEMQGASPAKVAFMGWHRTARELQKVREQNRENENKNRLKHCAALALERHCKHAFAGHQFGLWRQASTQGRQQRCTSAALDKLFVRGVKFVEWQQAGAASVLRQQVFDRWHQQSLRQQAARTSALAMLARGDRALTASILAEWRLARLSLISDRTAVRAHSTLHAKLHEREGSMLAWYTSKGVRRLLLSQIMHVWCKIVHATVNARRLGLQLFCHHAHALMNSIFFCWKHLLALENSAKLRLNQKHVFERLRASEIAGRLELRNMVRNLSLRILQSWKLAVAQRRLLSSVGLKSAAILSSRCSNWLLKYVLTEWRKLHEAASAAKAAQEIGRNLACRKQLSSDRLAVWHSRRGPLRQLLMQALLAWRHWSAVHCAAMACAGVGGALHMRALLIGAICHWIFACRMTQIHQQLGSACRQLEERCHQRGSRLVSCYLLKGVSRQCLLRCLLAWSKLVEARRTRLRASMALVSGKAWALRASVFSSWARRYTAARHGQSWALSAEARQGASLALWTFSHWRLAAEAGARHRTVAAAKEESAGKFRQEEVCLAAWQSDRCFGKLVTSKTFSAWQARLRLRQAVIRSAGALVRCSGPACLAVCMHAWLRAAVLWRTQHALEIQQANLRYQVHSRGDALAQWHCRKSFARLLQSQSLDGWRRVVAHQRMARRSGLALAAGNKQTYLSSVFQMWCQANLIIKVERGLQGHDQQLADEAWHQRSMGLIDFRSRHSAEYILAQAFGVWASEASRARAEFVLQHRGARAAEMLAQGQHKVLLGLVVQGWSHVAISELHAQETAATVKCWADRLGRRCEALEQWCSQTSQRKLLFQVFSCWSKRVNLVRFGGSIILRVLASKDLDLLVAVFSQLRRVCDLVRHQRTSKEQREKLGAVKQREDDLLIWHEQHGQAGAQLCQVLARWRALAKSLRRARSAALAAMAACNTFLLRLSLSALWRSCSVAQRERAKEAAEQLAVKVRNMLTNWQSTQEDLHVKDWSRQVFANWLKLMKSLRHARKAALSIVGASDVSLLRICFSDLCRVCYDARHQRALQHRTAEAKNKLGCWLNARRKDEEAELLHQVFSSWSKVVDLWSQARTTAFAIAATNESSLLRVIFSELCRICRAARHQHALTASDQHAAGIRNRLMCWLSIRSNDRSKVCLYQAFAGWLKEAQSLREARRAACAALAASDASLLKMCLLELWRFRGDARHARSLAASDRHAAGVVKKLDCWMRGRAAGKNRAWLHQAFAGWLKLVKSLRQARRRALTELSTSNTFLLAMIFSELWRLCGAAQHQSKMAAGDHYTVWIRNRFLCSLTARRDEKHEMWVHQVFTSWVRLIKSLHGARSKALALMSACDSGLLRIIFASLQRVSYAAGNQRALATADVKAAKVRDRVMSWHSIRGQRKVLLVQTWAAWHAASLKIAETLRAGLFGEERSSLELQATILSGWRFCQMRERKDRAEESSAKLRSQLQWNGTLALAARRVGEGEQVKAVLFSTWARQASRHSIIARLDALRQDQEDLPWLICVLACWRSCGKEQRLLNKQQEMAALLAQAGAKLVEAGQREIKQGRAENKAVKCVHSVASDTAKHSYAAASRAATRLIRRLLLTAWSRVARCKLMGAASNAVLFALRQETHAVKRKVWASWKTCKTLGRPRLIAARGTLSRAADKRGQAALRSMLRAWLMHVVGRANYHQQAAYLSAFSDKRHARSLVSVAFATWALDSVRAKSNCSTAPKQVSRAPRKSDSPIATESGRPLPPSVLQEYGVVRSPHRILQTSIVSQPVEAPEPPRAQAGAIQTLPSDRIFHVNARADASMHNPSGVSGRAASCRAPAQSHLDGISMVPRAASCHAPVSVPLIAPVYGRAREEPATVKAVTKVAAASTEANQSAATAIATALRDGMASVFSHAESAAAVPVVEGAAEPTRRRSWKGVSPAAGITGAPTPVRADAGLQPIRAPSLGFDAAAAMASWAGQRRQGKTLESSDAKHVGSATPPGLTSVCPRCGSTYMWDAVFCRHCGQKRGSTPGSSLQIPAAQS